MTIFSLLKKQCTHDKMGFNVECGYCPDCGAYVENRWFIVRCACCGVKRISYSRGNEVMPVSCFCSNCGDSVYYVEEVKKLNFVDINYATVLKITPKSVKFNFSQSWVQTAPSFKMLSLIN